MIIRIRNNLWNIVFVNPMSKELIASNGDRVLGVCDNNIKTIFIANNQTDSKTEHIICHEITHAMCFEQNIDIPYELEERLCNFMADYGRENYNAEQIRCAAIKSAKHGFANAYFAAILPMYTKTH